VLFATLPSPSSLEKQIDALEVKSNKGNLTFEKFFVTLPPSAGSLAAFSF